MTLSLNFSQEYDGWTPSIQYVLKMHTLASICFPEAGDAELGS